MPIYLDHNATTPVAPGVLDAMLPYLRDQYGNPSSGYALGRAAKDAVATARGHVAALIDADPDEIIFTSGGTEANNIAIRGSIEPNGGARAIVTSAVEHPATDEPCDLMARQDYVVHRVRVGGDGRVDVDEAARLIRAGVGLVTLIHAQNETGVLQPVAEIAAAARAHGALIHVDSAQAIGKIEVDVAALGVDLLSIAGHKLYAPKGIGVLYVRRGVRTQSVLRGAGQESGRRPGTENVASIVGLGEACRLAAERLRDDSGARMATLTRALFTRLQQAIPDIVLTWHPTAQLPNTLNVLFPGVSGRAVLDACPQVLASTGSACHADREEASAILSAMGIPEHKALGAVRLSLGAATTAREIDDAADALVAAWRLTLPHGLHPV
ncbi:MAG: cysteine desulfurase [Xanthobacteraceae bacterium]|nr:cysteine desulfurase [Xanthobacteraceae bacterium]